MWAWRKRPGTVDIWATSSCSLLVPSGPTWAQCCINHLHLVVQCSCACLTLWLGGSKDNQFMMGNSEQSHMDWWPIVKPVWCLLEEKGDQGLCWLNYGIRAREFIYPLGKTVRVHCWPHLLKINCFWWSWLMGFERNAYIICIYNSYISGTGEVFICSKQWNYIWNSSCNWIQHIITFTIINCHSLRSIWFLHRQVEWRCEGNRLPCIL